MWNGICRSKSLLERYQLHHYPLWPKRGAASLTIAGSALSLWRTTSLLLPFLHPESLLVSTGLSTRIARYSLRRHLADTVLESQERVLTCRGIRRVLTRESRIDVFGRHRPRAGKAIRLK
jgi:hypothetical protein